MNENGTPIPSTSTPRMTAGSGSYFASRKRRRAASGFSSRNFFVKNWTSTESGATSRMMQLRMSWDESVGHARAGSSLRSPLTNFSRSWHPSRKYCGCSTRSAGLPRNMSKAESTRRRGYRRWKTGNPWNRVMAGRRKSPIVRGSRPSSAGKHVELTAAR